MNEQTSEPAQKPLVARLSIDPARLRRDHDLKASPFRIVVGPNNSRVVKLQHPVANDAVRIDAIMVRRMSVADVREFVVAAEGDPNATPPMFSLPSGEPIPQGVLDALDHDDWTVLDEIASDFLPSALRGPVASAPSSPTGEASPA